MNGKEKSARDKMFRYVLSSLSRTSSDDDEGDNNDGRMDFSVARDLIGGIASWAGKGKDEIVQVLCREIGVAVAAVIREPLTQVLENRKLRITVELVPKTKEGAMSPRPAVKKSRPKRPGRARS